MMESLAIYLFRSVIWLTGFALVYLLFLRNERFFLLKRIYLLTGILASLVCPLFTIHYQVEAFEPLISTNGLIPAGMLFDPAGSAEAETGTFSFIKLLTLIYLTGIIVLVSRMLWHILLISKTIRKAARTKYGEAWLVKDIGFRSSFTFFNYVFINPETNESEIKEILNHEMVHVNQMHWLDLILAETLRIFQWLNPFAWIYTGFIRVNHEYMADEGALLQTSNPVHYRAALINQLFRSPVISLSNSFNYSLNKKRFDMMKTIITSPYRKLKLFLVLPVVAGILYAFATPEYNYINQEDNTAAEFIIYQSAAIVQNEIKGIVLNEEDLPFPGVSIVVTGTTIRSVSDDKGSFKLEGVPENSFLVFSIVGYKTELVKAVFNEPITIRLLKDPEYKPSDRITEFKIPVRTNEDEPFVVVEEMPMYPGGEIELLKFIADNTQYPDSAKTAGIEGRVIVRFIVTKEGNVEGISVIKGVHPLLDEEALRVVSLLKDFRPGMQGGQPVNVWYMVPITFTLK